MLENRNFSGIMFSIQFDVAIRKRNTPNWSWTHFSCSFWILGHAHSEQTQAKSMKTDANQWNQAFLLVLQDLDLRFVVIFFPMRKNARKQKLFWNHVLHTIWCGHKKKKYTKLILDTFFVLIPSCVQWQKWPDSPTPLWETLLVGICLDFEYNKTGNPWFFTFVAEFQSSQLFLELELDRFKIY